MSGSVATGGRVTYAFWGLVGQSVTIRMTKTSDTLDPFLSLYGTRAQILLAFDDDSGGDVNALISGFRVPDTGWYRIVAEGFGDSFGSFNLVLVVN